MGGGDQGRSGGSSGPLKEEREKERQDRWKSDLGPHPDRAQEVDGPRFQEVEDMKFDGCTTAPKEETIHKDTMNKKNV